MAIKTEKVKDGVSNIISAFFSFLFGLVNICITVFLMIGAVASVLILYRMFPDTALLLYKPFLTVFNIIFIIIKTILISIFILVLVYFVLSIVYVFEKAEKNHEKKRKKFMNEIVSKLKKELKNK